MNDRDRTDREHAHTARDARGATSPASASSPLSHTVRTANGERVAPTPQRYPRARPQRDRSASAHPSQRQRNASAPHDYLDGTGPGTRQPMPRRMPGSHEDEHAGRPTPEPAAGQRRVHMGVATADPQYLPPMAEGTRRPGGAAPLRPAHQRSEQRAPLHYDRYLQTPKPGKSIFTARHDRSRRRVKRLLAVLIVLAIALALVWFFVLR